MKIVEQSVELMDELVEETILKRLETVARNAYRSENEDDDIELTKKFIKKIISRNHLGILEHILITFKVKANRAILNEMTRHRMSSFVQACVTGDTLIRSGYKKYNKTIEELYMRKMSDVHQTRQSLYRRRTSSVNKDNIVTHNHICDVSYNGVRPVYKVTTKHGYVIKATKEHKFKTINGYVKLEDLSVGSSVLVNGKYRWGVDEDIITNIEYVGEEKVYDLSMCGDNHNYIANGFVVHNSTRYIKFKDDIEVIVPNRIVEGTETYKIWVKAMRVAEDSYHKLLAAGVSGQNARDVLPLSLASDIIVTMNLRSWLHYFELRTAKAAHPQIRQISNQMLDILKEKLPTIFN